jgi:hypothetical protein
MWNWMNKSVPQMTIVVDGEVIRGRCTACQRIFDPDPKLGTGVLQDSHLQKLFSEHLLEAHNRKPMRLFSGST